MSLLIKITTLIHLEWNVIIYCVHFTLRILELQFGIHSCNFSLCKSYDWDPNLLCFETKCHYRLYTCHYAKIQEGALFKGTPVAKGVSFCIMHLFVNFLKKKKGGRVRLSHCTKLLFVNTYYFIICGLS